MGKVILGILMVTTGLMGLAATLCGIAFLPAQGLGLIGIIPGVVLLWAAWAMWKSFKAPERPPAEAAEPPADGN